MIRASKFWAYVDRTNGCWLWTGRVLRGYGKYDSSQGPRSAHRIAYQLLIGPIPEGMELDHRCHTEDQSCPGGTECLHRRCVNPGHLDPVTRRENEDRRMARYTHCAHGHEYTPENTGSQGSGHRQCKACMRARNERRRRANGVRPAPPPLVSSKIDDLRASGWTTRQIANHFGVTTSAVYMATRRALARS